MSDELKRGIRNIESALISSVCQRGGNISEQSFVWNYRAADDKPPEIIWARITANARIASLILPREYCESSASTVNLKEVHDAINNCVRLLTG